MKIAHSIKFPRIPGVECYLVGGAVRDLILGKEPKDLDFILITKKSLTDVMDELMKMGVIIFQAKPEFQTLLCRIDGKNVDLIFPRREWAYSDGRRPDKTERTDDLVEDSNRRDFTINSMYMKEDGEIIDYQGGLKDIENKVIRSVGSPDERIKEDPLRILRAIRFAVSLGFTIEEETAIAISWNRMLLCSAFVSNDRIKSEINKALRADPRKTIELLDDMELLNILKMKDEHFRIEIVNRM